MGVRRQTKNRLTLFRECGTCGKTFQTTADSPWIRQIERDGKKQATTYYCSSPCFQASYKHIGWYDGLAKERKRLRDEQRDVREKNRRYYAAHAEQERERQKARYWANHDDSLETLRYNRRKRKLVREEREGTAP